MYLVLVHSLLSTIQQSNEEAMQTHGATCPAFFTAWLPAEAETLSYAVAM
jgi:hypothetical protein